MEFTVERFKLEYYDRMIKHFYTDADINYVEEFLIDPNTVAFVALEEEEVVGLIYGYKLTRLNTNPMLYIHSVDVKKGYRGKGIGTLMMKRMLKYAEDYSIYKTFLITNISNVPANKLYQKVGGKIKYDDDVVYEFKKSNN